MWATRCDSFQQFRPVSTGWYKGTICWRVAMPHGCMLLMVCIDISQSMTVPVKMYSFLQLNRYEGEFVNNRMQGYGVYVWKDGTWDASSNDLHALLSGIHPPPVLSSHVIMLTDSSIIWPNFNPYLASIGANGSKAWCMDAEFGSSEAMMESTVLWCVATRSESSY